MRKIFSILVVLMMVAGTFVSCNMPTNDTPTVNTVDISATDIPNCDLSYLTLANGKKAICTDAFREFIKNAPDKQSALEQHKEVTIMDSAPNGWDRYVYDVSEGWITEVDWGNKSLKINNGSGDPVPTNLDGLKYIYLPDSYKH